MPHATFKHKTRRGRPLRTWALIFRKSPCDDFGPAFRARQDLRSAWRLWHLSVLRQWVEETSGEESSISCLGCGNAMGLDVEPLLKGAGPKTGPRRPEDGQVVCLECYGSGRDVRPAAFRRFVASRAARDWACTRPGGWVLKTRTLAPKD